MSGFLPETFFPSQKQVLQRKLKELHSFFVHARGKVPIETFIQNELSLNFSKYT